MFFTFDMSSLPCLLYNNNTKFTSIWLGSIPSMRCKIPLTSFFISFTSWTSYFFITGFCRIFHLLTKKLFSLNTFLIIHDHYKLDSNHFHIQVLHIHHDNDKPIQVLDIQVLHIHHNKQSPIKVLHIHHSLPHHNHNKHNHIDSYHNIDNHVHHHNQYHNHYYNIDQKVFHIHNHFDSCHNIDNQHLKV